MIRNAPYGLRALIRFHGKSYSSSSAPSVLLPETAEKVNEELSAKSTNVENEEKKAVGIRNVLVSAAFQSLKDEGEGAVSIVKKLSETEGDTEMLSKKISSSKDAKSLLQLTESHIISKKHSLQIVSKLASLVTQKLCKQSDFESDPRFTKLCLQLGRKQSLAKEENIKNTFGVLDDLSLVLGVSGNEEAAKLISSLSLNQMIKVMSGLAVKKRRAIPLLRSLAYNITQCSEKFNVKQAADLLFAMSVLNFPDEILLDKVTADLCDVIPKNENSSIIGSILTSLKFLRYKNTELLEILSEWVLNHCEQCRTQDLVASVVTMATLHYHSNNSDVLYPKIIPQLSRLDIGIAEDWLKFVWSLVILNKATPTHIESVLQDSFVKSFTSEDNNSNDNENGGNNISSKLKLLNINAAAKLLVTNYKGPLLDNQSSILNLSPVSSTDKQKLITSVQDSFSSLLPSSNYLKANVLTDMGFKIDGEFIIDKKCNPIPVSSKIGKDSKVGFRVAIMVQDYKDMCRGSTEKTGINHLYSRLLEAQGYKMLNVPYTEFNPKEKLVRRVQYLEQKLKAVVKSS